MQTKEYLILLAKSIALSNDLSSTLVCAICEQESNWNPWAVRYEPAFFIRYTSTLKVSETEKYSRAFSYGLMQIMGQTAREFGFSGQYCTEICDPETSLSLGCKKLKHCLSLSNGNVEDALLKYNGGGNKSYPSSVLSRMKNYL